DSRAYAAAHRDERNLHVQTTATGGQRGDLHVVHKAEVYDVDWDFRIVTSLEHLPDFLLIGRPFLLRRGFGRPAVRDEGNAVLEQRADVLVHDLHEAERRHLQRDVAAQRLADVGLRSLRHGDLVAERNLG